MSTYRHYPGRPATLTAEFVRARYQELTARIEPAERTDDQSRLRSVTGGHGSYSIEYSHCAAVPVQRQLQLMWQFKGVAEED